MTSGAQKKGQQRHIRYRSHTNCQQLTAEIHKEVYFDIRSLNIRTNLHISCHTPYLSPRYIIAGKQTHCRSYIVNTTTAN